MRLLLFCYYFIIFGLPVCIVITLFYPLSGSPECSRPSGRWRGQQPEAGCMHVQQLKQALVGVAATRLREQDDEVWVRDEDDDDDDNGNR